MSNNIHKSREKSFIHLVVPGELPTNLFDYADSPLLIGAALKQKLGANAFWLVADRMYAMREAGAKDGDTLYSTSQLVLPVRYEELRKIRRDDEITPGAPIETSQLANDSRVAIFSLRQELVRQSSALIAHGFTRYVEIGVDVHDPVTLLDENEYDLPVSHRV